MDIALKKYIEAQLPELKGRIHPVFTTDLSELTLVYMITPLSGGHVKQSMAELKIIWNNVDACKEMEEKLNAILDMEEDTPYRVSGRTIFHSSLAGGGTLFNEEIQMYEVTIIYTIDWRKKNEQR